MATEVGGKLGWTDRMGFRPRHKLLVMDDVKTFGKTEDAEKTSSWRSVTDRM